MSFTIQLIVVGHPAAESGLITEGMLHLLLLHSLVPRSTAADNIDYFFRTLITWSITAAKVT